MIRKLGNRVLCIRVAGLWEFRLIVVGSAYISISLLSALSIVISIPTLLNAEQPPDLVTDRPTKAANTAIVQPGYVLLETGLKFLRDEPDGSRKDKLDLFDSLLRIGLAKKFEARLGWVPGKWQETNNADSTETSNGVGDAVLAGKLKLREESGYVPAISLILGTGIPVGHDDFSSQRFDPFIHGAFSHSLPNNLGLVYNLGVVGISEQSDSGGTDTHVYFDYSGVLSYGGNPLFAPYLEVYGLAPISDSGTSSSTLGGGITSLVFPNFQLDASGGIGLTDSATDWFVGIGLSVRFPR